MKFSVCIPNYNYARYLERTLRSVLEQDGVELEIAVSDNASTDGSVDVVRSLRDARIRVQVNACNVGFAGNLDRAAQMATGDFMLMLSSDDVVRPGAFATYASILRSLGDDAARSIITSTAEIIDENDRITGRLGPELELWRASDEITELPVETGAKVYRVEARELLARCLRSCRNPFNFLATVYSRSLYREIEGYGSGRLINPDKWFHWRLLGAASHAYFVDKPLFAYRWHGSNQVANQARAGALKFLVDEYANTLELPESLLEKVGMRRSDIERAFVEYDVIRHGLAELARGSSAKARRILLFGTSVYPTQVAKSPGAWLLAALLAAGPIGVGAARLGHRIVTARNRPEVTT